MSDSSEITRHIQLRLRMTAYATETIARSRQVLARSEALLQQDMPTTFLGERHYPPSE